MPNISSINISGLKHITVLVAGLISIQLTGQQFSKADVLSDLLYIKTSLEQTHIDLYAHVTKDAFDKNYKEVRDQIVKDSLSRKEVLNYFQQVVAKANNAHTRINFNDYISAYANYAYSEGVVFPLEVAIENGKALIRMNWSANDQIKIGAELRSINGMPICEVLEKIYPQISAERPYFANALLETNTLPRFYWQLFGEQREFEVEIIQDGNQSTYKLQAVKALEDYEYKRTDILINTWELNYPAASSAYLRPGEFGGEEDKFQRYIDSAFTDINAKGVENLIIDLRNHSGGNDSFGDYLVSYIADKPFKWTDGFKLKTSALLKEDIRKNRDTTQAYWKSALVHEDGEIYSYDFGFYEPQPAEKRFNGKVYVLVNRQSYSQSTVTAAQIQDYGFAQIVGEETAEYPNLYASIFSYQLPNTGLIVDIPKGKIQRISGVDDGKGLIPDIEIKDHLLDEKDEILEGLLKKIALE